MITWVDDSRIYGVVESPDGLKHDLVVALGKGYQSWFCKKLVDKVELKSISRGRWIDIDVIYEAIKHLIEAGCLDLIR